MTGYSHFKDYMFLVNDPDRQSISPAVKAQFETKITTCHTKKKMFNL